MANKTIQSIENEFRNYVKKIEDFNQALSLLAWDSRTGAPKKEWHNALRLLAHYLQKYFKCPLPSK